MNNFLIYLLETWKNKIEQNKIDFLSVAPSPYKSRKFVKSKTFFIESKVGRGRVEVTKDRLSELNT